MKHPERRGAPRVNERVALDINHDQAAFRAETNNLSTSGAYCTLERFLAPMTKLELELTLPNSPARVTIRCRGVVVRVEPVAADLERGRYHVAIFFTDLAARDRSAIERFVRQRLSATPSTD